MRKVFRVTLISLGLLILLPVAGFFIWGLTPAGPMPEALAAIHSGSQVSVESSGDWLVFLPAGSQPTTGIMIYPGGHVDFRSYAPLAYQIAAEGYMVVIIPMPLNLAVFDPGAATEVIAAYPDIEQWVVGGHSLGGAMAANFAKKHPGEVDGLVLWAAYPASGDDLTDSRLKVASIYATQDGLTTSQDIEASRALLPVDSIWAPIAGGNHGQFGWFGKQAGDNPATISREEQQKQIVDNTIALLRSLQ